jgi:hypothetical protein
MTKAEYDDESEDMNKINILNTLSVYILIQAIQENNPEL